MLLRINVLNTKEKGCLFFDQTTVKVVSDDRMNLQAGLISTTTITFPELVV